MARTPPTPKRGKPPVKLRGNRQPLAISLPPELVAEIDALAAAQERSRVKMIEFACREYVQAHRPKAVAA
jgi:metal-responsive CopG/Arc/MetJ family transcriptional regulator